MTECRCDVLVNKLNNKVIGAAWNERCPITEHAPSMKIETVDEYGTMRMKFKTGYRFVTEGAIYEGTNK